MKKFIIDVWKCLRLQMVNFSGALGKVRNNLALRAEYSDLVRFRTAAATPGDDRLKQADYASDGTSAILGGSTHSRNGGAIFHSVSNGKFIIVWRTSMSYG